MQLHTPVEKIRTVGKALKQRLSILGIETAQDLLLYYPFRYEDYSETMAIKQLQDGMRVSIRAKITLIANKRSPRRRTMITEAIVSDATGSLRIVWFGQPYIIKNIHVGDEVFFSGAVKRDMFGLSMTSPAYEKVMLEPAIEGTVHTARIVPMYSLTAGITQKQLRFLVSEAMVAADRLPDWIPEEMRVHAQVVPYAEAIRGIHFPDNEIHLEIAKRRMKFDELFLTQLRAEMVRQSLQRLEAPKLTFHEDEIKSFVASLPFSLTKGQKVAAWEMIKDMDRTEPMNRLLEGDVGSGKTVVGALAMYNAVLSGYQAALMAPTEILAKQHFESLLHVLGEKTTIVLVTGSMLEIHEKGSNKSTADVLTGSKAAQKRMVREWIEQGKVDIIIGTQALLSEGVEFFRLGLVIVDEQHRFGVEQRKTLHTKSGSNVVPHFLSMTATPIPRSFALALYGDLDISILKELPPGRKQIKTRVVEPKLRDKAYAFIRDQVKEGRQVFVICPLIEEAVSDKLVSSKQTEDKKTVMSEFEKLSKEIFPDLRVSYLHGKMKSKEKDAVMNVFAQHECDILISTSVIEVGVNIPNATVMMIEGADRFGLAQLHQFRGRVGRSVHQSYCLLFTDSTAQKVKERLAFFESTPDGFAVAEYDLEVRGPGEVYGKAQSGMTQFRFATMKDMDLITVARGIARGIRFDAFPTLKEKVVQWEQTLHLE